LAVSMVLISLVVKLTLNIFPTYPPVMVLSPPLFLLYRRV
jgi:hypothetical protein